MLAALNVIRDYIRDYYEAVFRRGYFISIICLLAVVISFSYSYPAPVFNSWWASFLFDYLLYLIPFAAAYLLQWFYFKEDRSAFSRPWFWIMLTVAPVVFALRVNFSWHEAGLQNIFGSDKERLVTAVGNYLVKAVMLIVPITFFWRITDKKNHSLYGFKQGRGKRPYFILLAMMVPLVIAAATLPGFLNTYPKALTSAGIYPLDGLPAFILFELAYAFDFLSIEFFFRGFLIIAFIRYCGMRAIIPAACFYCCIHLGKPMPEAISSFFGGLLLGIISYHTLSIWGGLIIHIGIAWLMEIAAYTVQHF